MSHPVRVRESPTGSTALMILVFCGSITAAIIVAAKVKPQCPKIDAWEYAVGSATFTTKDRQLAESFRALHKELEELKAQLAACSRRNQ